MPTTDTTQFPFLFGGTFIEGRRESFSSWFAVGYFPSFSEGLSLREINFFRKNKYITDFPSFSEGLSLRVSMWGDSVSA